MYLIECNDDASLCIVEDNEVFCDENVQVRDVITFVYQRKYYTGTIIMHSGKSEKIYYIYYLLITQ